MPKQGYHQTEKEKENKSKAGRAYWESLSKEQQIEVMSRRYNTPNRKELNKLASLAGHTPEAKQKRKDSLKKYWDSLTPEQRQERKSKHLKVWSGYSEKEYLDRTKNFSGHTKSEESKEKCRKSNQKFWNSLSPEEFQERVNKSGKKHLQGHFLSKKNSSELFYQSSYELRAFERLEADSNVRHYKRCDDRIEYIIDNSCHIYNPDTLVEYLNGSKLIIEIKPFALLNLPINIAKHQALVEYCRNLGITCKIWTEKDLECFQQTS